MFLRTERLFLRPAWPEDAAELTRAIGHEPVARTLAQVPWPYREADARGWIEAEHGSAHPALLVTLPESAGRIVGGCGLRAHLDGTEVGYWIAPDCWNRGFATEALAGLLTLARTIGHRRLHARHALDNRASGRVLRKAGFRPTGRAPALQSLGDGGRLDGAYYTVTLDQADGPADRPLRQAA